MRLQPDSFNGSGLGFYKATYLKFKIMKKLFYSQPTLAEINVEVEAGFATSYEAGTPGRDIGYNDYGDEL